MKKDEQMKEMEDRYKKYLDKAKSVNYLCLRSSALKTITMLCELSGYYSFNSFMAEVPII